MALTDDLNAAPGAASKKASWTFSLGAVGGVAIRLHYATALLLVL